MKSTVALSVLDPSTPGLIEGSLPLRQKLTRQGDQRGPHMKTTTSAPCRLPPESIENSQSTPEAIERKTSPEKTPTSRIFVTLGESIASEIQPTAGSVKGKIQMTPKKSTGRRLTDLALERIRRLLALGAGHRAVAAHTKHSQSTITDIANGKTNAKRPRCVIPTRRATLIGGGDGGPDGVDPANIDEVREMIRRQGGILLDKHGLHVVEAGAVFTIPSNDSPCTLRTIEVGDDVDLGGRVVGVVTPRAPDDRSLTADAPVAAKERA